MFWVEWDQQMLDKTNDRETVSDRVRNSLRGYRTTLQKRCTIAKETAGHVPPYHHLQAAFSEQPACDYNEM